MRARVVLYNQNIASVLLIHRLKNSRGYWVIPGGGSKGQETSVQTAIREISEELKISLAAPDLTFMFKIADEFIFLAKIAQIKIPEISGEEKERANQNNVYKPTWVKISKLTDIDLMPPEIAQQILNKLKSAR